MNIFAFLGTVCVVCVPSQKEVDAVRELPERFASAGAWGYIGKQLLLAALDLGIPEIHVYDPGPRPRDLDPRVIVHEDDASFYGLDALFHLALHPQDREAAMRALLTRQLVPPVLCEKPMVPPKNPEACNRITAAVRSARAVWMYNFLELFDPMTHAAVEWLMDHRSVSIHEIEMYRGKDREADTERNYKVMVDIEYQEAVHCMAFFLYLFGSLHGGLPAMFRSGIEIRSQSQPYCPPNPKDYHRVVNGRCEYTIFLRESMIRGITNFKQGAQTAKRKVITGLADSKPFRIEINNQEGEKCLIVNGKNQGFEAGASTYQNIITTFWGWYKNLTREELMAGVYPNPTLTHAAYQLSSVLWRSSWRGSTITLGSLGELLGFEARYHEASMSLPLYDK